jgi:hypothetical protein
MTMNLRPNITHYKRQIMKKLCSCGAFHDLPQILQHCGHDSTEILHVGYVKNRFQLIGTISITREPIVNRTKVHLQQVVNVAIKGEVGGNPWLVWVHRE